MKTLTLAGFPILAHSVGGIETCIHLPEQKLAFDIGKCPEHVVPRERIFFTHGHMDHMGGIAYHCSTRALRRMQPPIYVLPPGYAPKVEALFEAWRALDHSEMPAQVLSLAPGERMQMNQNAYVQPFQAYHTAPCQGYALWSMREKLKPEYAELKGEAIRDLRRAGTQISAPVETPQVAFCGDTMIEVVERQEVVRKARLLILECTFIDESIGPEEARSRGHLHLDELAERAHLFENEAILLHHFSPRFSRSAIIKALDERLPAGLRERVTPLLAGFH